MRDFQHDCGTVDTYEHGSIGDPIPRHETIMLHPNDSRSRKEKLHVEFMKNVTSKHVCSALSEIKMSLLNQEK